MSITWPEGLDSRNLRLLNQPYWIGPNKSAWFIHKSNATGKLYRLVARGDPDFPKDCNERYFFEEIDQDARPVMVGE